ncbi:HNH endonuclease domain-containing protein [Halomonas cerina]|uniref:5-methylcytosine-specific restriction endonuclease McrA n=1 Tax=Halomonas cerina TaxID=447424 RepID=A0A839V4W4_9GAMM|nr:HNH endonuclease domain-containing protein [Halomonas cerina]MBB3190723.1 5-methylcytosine-specific restriction endonuclease McrA [Halomonas cerina]
MTIQPPPCGEIDIHAFSQLFNSTTNSYKLAFFQALLNTLMERERSGARDAIIELRELATEMLALAWYPHNFFRLSFGLQDQTGSVLDRLDFNLDERSLTNPNTHARLRQAIADQYDTIHAAGLLRFVPYRLLSPFFTSELKGLKDSQKDRRIRELSNARFSSHSPPIYRFTEGGNAIDVYPAWRDYLVQHIAIIDGWVKHNWIGYLQDRNPSTPAIIKKITPPLQRSPLTRQTRFWQAVMAQSTQQCIYTGNPIEPSDFALDHFIPWSFVCHDQLWNLIPVSSTVNSSKGSRLPLETHVGRFIEAQYHALKIGRSQLTDTAWNKATEPYVSDLQLSPQTLLDGPRLDSAYRNTLSPLISLARQMGFADFHGP